MGAGPNRPGPRGSRYSFAVNTSWHALRARVTDLRCSVVSAVWPDRAAEASLSDASADARAEAANSRPALPDGRKCLAMPIEAPRREQLRHTTCCRTDWLQRHARPLRRQAWIEPARECASACAPPAHLVHALLDHARCAFVSWATPPKTSSAAPKAIGMPLTSMPERQSRVPTTFQAARLASPTPVERS
jgi:hypothetical protein